MKILFLSNITGGLWSFRKELIQSLLSKGNQVYIGAAKTHKADELSKLGCELIDIPLERRGTNPAADARLFFRYCGLLRTVRPDVVLTYTIKPNVYGGLACGLKGVPYLPNITGLGSAVETEGWLSRLTVTLYKLGLKKAYKVFFQNKANQEYFTSRRIATGNTERIPGSGVNLTEHPLEPYPEDDGTVRFLFIGRILKDKGIDELLEAAVRVKKKYPDAVFSLVGGYDDSSYKEKLDALEQAGILRYYGHQNDVHSFIKDHHATVLPSYHEGIANVLLESAACGRPVLASSVPGCEETFEEGVTGLGFPAKSAEDLYRAMETFLLLPYGQKAQMGRLGRQKVEREFDRTLVVNAYLSAIHEISNLKEEPLS